MPYDTLQKVIGLTDGKRGTLAEKGVKFSYVPLKDNLVDYDEAEKILRRDQPKVVAIQRSRGYSTRKTFTIDQIKEMIAFVKKVSPQSIVFIDNCYGEFSEKHEATEYGADLMAGSLIKNAGGGLAKMGMNVTPAWDEKRSDIIETIIFNDPDKMIKFVQEVQKNSPIDSFVTPEAVPMEGYEDKIIMAAGNFVSGSTIEFSADGLVRPPYVVYMQGGLTYAHDKVDAINAVRGTFFNQK